MEDWDFCRFRMMTIHCSATTPEMDWDIKDIRRVHVKENGWSDVGYHFFIKRDGTIQPGRPLNRDGAHVKGENLNNLGVCLSGGMVRKGRQLVNDSGPNMYTENQWASLFSIAKVYAFSSSAGLGSIRNHYDLDKSKTCPNINAASIIWCELLR